MRDTGRVCGRQTVCAGSDREEVRMRQWKPAMRQDNVLTGAGAAHNAGLPTDVGDLVRGWDDVQWRRSVLSKDPQVRAIGRVCCSCLT